MSIFLGPPYDRATNIRGNVAKNCTKIVDSCGILTHLHIYRKVAIRSLPSPHQIACISHSQLSATARSLQHGSTATLTCANYFQTFFLVVILRNMLSGLYLSRCALPRLSLCLWRPCSDILTVRQTWTNYMYKDVNRIPLYIWEKRTRRSIIFIQQYIIY